MNTYDLALDIKRILAIFDISIEYFCDEIGVSRVTINDILNGKKDTFSNELLEKIYSYAYRKEIGIDLNRSKELLYLDEANGKTLLFHGAKNDIDGDIDNKHSLPPNDFGNGFYTGTTLKQAASRIAKYEKGSVYCFYLKDIDKLNVLRFNADKDWLYAVLYYRKAFTDFVVDENTSKIIDKIENSDLVIAPIADNEMFKTIDSFARNEITDEACLHAISASNLGFQYIFKSDLACKHLSFLERLYLCEKERNYYLLEKDNLTKEGINKSNLAKIEYRRKGLYFDELFKRKG